MANWKNVTILPRLSLGESSAKYKGTVAATIPMAKPKSNLPAMSELVSGAIAANIEPTTKIKDAIMLIFLRPNLSVKKPEIKGPNMAPKSTAPTNMLSCDGVSCNCSRSEGRATFITPVSKPKSRPPVAATAAIK